MAPIAMSSATRLDGDARELFDGRETGRDLRDAVVPECSHALGDRGTLEVLAARLLDRERLELLAHLEQLVDADPAAIARLVAARAAALAVEGHPVRRGGDVGRDARPQELVYGRLVHLAA